MPNISIPKASFEIEQVAQFSEADFQKLPDFARSYFRLVKSWLQGESPFPFQTSGSTGKPKTLHFSHSKLLQSAKTSIETFGLTASKGMFICLPEKYVAGKMMLIRALATNMDIYLVPPASIPPIAELPAHKKWAASFVPLQLENLLDKGMSAEMGERIDHVLLGGGPLSAELEKQIREQCSFPVYHTFGMTETLTHFAYRDVNGSENSPAYEVIKGFEVGVGAEGQLRVKGSVTDQQWLTTNDAIEMVSSRSFQWKGRLDNVINSGGIKHSPEAIEAKIAALKLPLLNGKSFFVTSLPDDTLGEKMVLLVEAKATTEVEKETILAAFKENLPRLEIPKEVGFLTPFERTESQKIKRQLTLLKWKEKSF